MASECSARANANHRLWSNPVVVQLAVASIRVVSVGRWLGLVSSRYIYISYSMELCEHMEPSESSNPGGGWVLGVGCDLLVVVFGGGGVVDANGGPCTGL